MEMVMSGVLSVAGVAVCLPVTESPSKEPLFRKMSGLSLSHDGQLRYMLQWFGEWSELQRQDFLPILAEKLSDAATYMNGVIHSMDILNCQNKPMSLFQCRIKLFNDWYPTWTEEERSRLVKGITDMDGDFGKKLQEEMTSAKEPKLNGEANGDEKHEETSAEEVTELEIGSQEINADDAIVDEDEVQENLTENPQMPLEIVATS